MSELNPNLALVLQQSQKTINAHLAIPEYQLHTDGGRTARLVCQLIGLKENDPTHANHNMLITKEVARSMQRAPDSGAKLRPMVFLHASVARDRVPSLSGRIAAPRS